MSFRSPLTLIALIVVPLVIGAYVRSRRRRTQRAAALAAEGLVTTAAGSQPARARRHLPFALYAAALTVLCVAIARPLMTISTPRREGTVVLAVDVSNSMRADDVKPTRVDAAKEAARAFVSHQPPNVRIGVVAFGEGAVVVQTPTTAHPDVVAAVNRLSVGGGTSLGEGMVASLSAIAGKPITINEDALASDAGQVDIGYYGSATIVMLTDGENVSRPDPVSVAEAMSVAGVHVHTIGVGTEAGTVVQVNGFNVATALNRDLLEKIATTTDASYHEGEDAAAL